LDGHEPLIQAYGLREAATGVAILASHDPAPWIWGRVGGDALDLATLAMGSRSDNGRTAALGVAAAAVIGVTALDVLCAQSLAAGKRLSPPGSYDYSHRAGFPDSVAAMRGAASDFDIPADFRVPELLRPWRDGRSGRSGEGE
jgi:hypothetical protein